MNVTPMERWEYLAGKSLLGFILPILHCICILFILDYGKTDYLQAFVVILCIALSSSMIFIMSLVVFLRLSKKIRRGLN